MITREQAHEFVRSLGYDPNVVRSVELDHKGVTVTHIDPDAKPLKTITTRQDFKGDKS